MRALKIPQFGHLNLTPHNCSLSIPMKTKTGRNSLAAMKIRCGPVSLSNIPLRFNKTKIVDRNVVPIRLTVQNGQIKMGPFIGLFTVKGKSRGFKGNFKYLADMTKAATELGYFMYVFTAEGLNFEKKQILGYHYAEKNGKGKWEQVIAPLPDVVYNRIPSRKEEQLPHIQDAIKKLNNVPNLSLFNPHYFDKWELFQLLSRNEELKHYLPPTEQINTIGQLKTFLGKNQSVYLKPIHSKAGTGIVLLNKSDNGYDFITQSKGVRIVKHYRTLEETWNAFTPFLQTRTYIAQRTVNLSLFESRPFDLRVLCQKNIRGVWDMTGIGVRHAGPESITTHVPQGGKIQDPVHVLEQVFGTLKSKELLQAAETLSLKLARGIEKETKKMLGEMSLDLGLDRNGKLWFFEANSKPMKFDEPHIKQKSFTRILQYCAYLSGIAGK